MLHSHIFIDSSLSCAIHRALAACGASVVQVSTGSPNIKNSNIETVSPAVGELDLGFADVVGEFDALLDTMSDEAKLTGMRVEESDVIEELATSGVVAELRKQHQCSRYVHYICVTCLLYSVWYSHTLI